MDSCYLPLDRIKSYWFEEMVASLLFAYMTDNYDENWKGRNV